MSSRFAHCCALLTIAVLLTAIVPHTAPDGDLNQDGTVDALDLQCEILVFSYLNLPEHPGGATCTVDADCFAVAGPNSRCGKGFGPGQICLPGCLSPAVALSDKDGDPCEDSEADDGDCLGLTPRRIADLDCDGATTSTDFIFLVAVIFDKAGVPGGADHDGDGKLNNCDDDSDDDGVIDEDDCAELDSWLFPGNDEVCDGLDNDCDDVADEGLGDINCGLGPCEHSVPACDGGETMFCDPLEGAVPEDCDGIDNDCDGIVDNGFNDHEMDGLADCVDEDDDNDGDPDITDCEPFNPAVSSLAPEICFNGMDDNCNNQQDEACAGQSCLKLLQANPGLSDGVYSIDPDGAGPLKAISTWCDMTTEGGGWTYGAIVKTTTSSNNRTRIPGVSEFGGVNYNMLLSEYSVNLTGIAFQKIRIDNFTKGEVVTNTVSSPAIWNATTYTSSNGYPAKKLTVTGSREFRTGYYGSTACGLGATNIPICFAALVPTGWVCDTDSSDVKGWVDPTGGELCGLYYCKKVWRGNSGCTSYVGQQAVYGFAIR